MVIAGARGFAKEVLEVLAQREELDNVYFFDNVTEQLPGKLFNRFPILRSLDEVKSVFSHIEDYRYTLGLGNPLLRYKVSRMLQGLGGQLTTVISPGAHVGHFGTIMEVGCNIMTGTVITNDITLGKGCLINLNCTIGHDTVIGDFVEMSPAVNVSGNCKIGSFCALGTGSMILPEVTLGQNVVVGAGAVVTKDVPDNCVVIGIPAVVKKKLDPLTF